MTPRPPGPPTPAEPESPELKDWKKLRAKRAGALFRQTMKELREKQGDLPSGF